MRRNDLYEEYDDFAAFLDDKLRYLYRTNQRPGKTFLMEYPVEALRPNPRPDIIEDLLQICRKENLTRVERQMIEQADGTTIEHELLDIKATMLFGQYRLEEALATLKEMDRLEWDRFGLFNPFAERMADCVHCLLPDSLPVFNRGDLIQELIDMEYEAKANPKMAAPLYYRLGIAYYNMTYFSYSWNAMDYFRSGTSLIRRLLMDGDDVIPNSRFPFGNREHFDCSMALSYFQRARSLANDPELAARASFWAAKCERNQYYVNRVSGAERSYRYFNDLTKNFSNTSYFARAYDRCLTFRAYADR